MPRFLFGFAFLLVLLAIGFVALGLHSMSGTVPVYEGSAKVAGISGSVDIDRDEFAIPHIHAATERDAFFGLGYAEAQDRLFQMEFARRLGQGRMSEIFGKRTLVLDKFSRTIGFARIADQMWAKAEPKSRDVITAYVAGINQYLKQNRAHLGFEFDALKLQPEDWRPQDCMILGRLMAWEMNFSYLSDAAFSDFALVLDSAHLRSLFPDYPADGATVVDGADPRNFVSNYLNISPIPEIAMQKPAPVATPVVEKVEPTPAPVPVPKKVVPKVIAPTKKKTTVASKAPAPKSAPRSPYQSVPKSTPRGPYNQTKPARPAPIPQGHTPAPMPRPHMPPPLKGTGMTEDIKQFFAELRDVQRAIDSTIGWHGTGGSNAFAIAPSRTADGSAILENDTHLSLSAPARWYVAHLTSDDGLNVAGFLVPGLPLFLSGRNADVSWGITNAMADETDYFVEKLDSSGNYYMRPNGAWEKLAIVHEKILVQDSIKSNLMLTVPLDIIETKDGPLVTLHPDSMIHIFHGDHRAGGVPDTNIFHRTGHALAMMWNGYYALTDELGGWVNMMHAKSIADARAGMSNFATPCLNLCMADTKGNIAYQYIGRMPHRNGSERSILLPRDGTSANDAWNGFVYMRDLPTITNPARGYIASANNPPVRNRTFPFSNNWEPSSRADRISELIERTPKLNESNVRDIQTDIVSAFDLRRILPYLLRLYPDPHPPRVTADSTSLFRDDSMRIFWKEDSVRKHGNNVSDSTLRALLLKDSLYFRSRHMPEDTIKTPKVDRFTAQVLDYLRNWDGGLRANEIAPAIYSVFLNRLLEHTYRDELGSERYSEFIYLGNIAFQSLARIMPDSGNIWWDDVTTTGPQPEHRDSIIQISFRETLRIMASAFGRDIRQWQWGRMHTLVYKHAFGKEGGLVAKLVNIDAGAMSGGPTTVSQATYDLWNPYEMRVGPSMRMIADMKSNDLLASLPTGNSEAMFGEHYRDMAEMFKRGELVHVPLFQRNPAWKRFELRPE